MFAVQLRSDAVKRTARSYPRPRERHDTSLYDATSTTTTTTFSTFTSFSSRQNRLPLVRELTSYTRPSIHRNRASIVKPRVSALTTAPTTATFRATDHNDEDDVILCVDRVSAELCRVKVHRLLPER